MTLKRNVTEMMTMVIEKRGDTEPIKMMSWTKRKRIVRIVNIGKKKKRSAVNASEVKEVVMIRRIERKVIEKEERKKKKVTTKMRMMMMVVPTRRGEKGREMAVRKNEEKTGNQVERKTGRVRVVQMMTRERYII